jgi:hypothetical protein
MIQDFVYNDNIKDFETFDFSKELISHFIQPTFYDSIEFHSYHKKFADKVYRLFVKTNDKLIGYCFIGVKADLLKAPYSSPFSMIYLRSSYKISDICIIISALKDFGKKIGVKKIQITLPPEIYSIDIVNSLSAAFFSEGFKVKLVDINNYFNLENYTDKDNYLKYAPHKVRQNYKNALKNNITFTEIPIESFRIAYEVIRINRQQMGYPLKISEQQMSDLMNMKSLKARCYIAKKEDVSVAAAIVFDVTEDTSQVVYWGDNLEYRNERPMDLLTAEVFNIYKELGKKYLDIGPSSEEGIINTGLVDFKKSIGCDSNIKLTFEYVL